MGDKISNDSQFKAVIFRKKQTFNHFLCIYYVKNDICGILVLNMEEK